jgi:hypothetical protein
MQTFATATPVFTSQSMAVQRVDESKAVSLHTYGRTNSIKRSDTHQNHSDVDAFVPATDASATLSFDFNDFGNCTIPKSTSLPWSDQASTRTASSAHSISRGSFCTHSSRLTHSSSSPNTTISRNSTSISPTCPSLWSYLSDQSQASLFSCDPPAAEYIASLRQHSSNRGRRPNPKLARVQNLDPELSFHGKTALSTVSVHLCKNVGDQNWAYDAKERIIEAHLDYAQIEGQHMCYQLGEKQEQPPCIFQTPEQHRARHSRHSAPWPEESISNHSTLQPTKTTTEEYHDQISKFLMVQRPDRVWLVNHSSELYVYPARPVSRLPTTTGQLAGGPYWDAFKEERNRKKFGNVKKEKRGLWGWLKRRKIV